MVTLPFVVQPRRQPILEQIGTEESGIIQIERRGYLTSGEKAFVQQVQQFDSGTTEIIALSRRVARTFTLGLDKAYSIIIGVISSNTDSGDLEIASKVEEEFPSELADIIRSLSANQVREDLIFACCMLRYRVDTEFRIDQIHQIHPDLIAALSALYREEEARSLEAFKVNKDEEPPTALPIEEVEKKSVSKRTSRSKTTTGD